VVRTTANDVAAHLHARQGSESIQLSSAKHGTHSYHSHLTDSLVSGSIHDVPVQRSTTSKRIYFTTSALLPGRVACDRRLYATNHEQFVE